MARFFLILGSVCCFIAFTEAIVEPQALPPDEHLGGYLPHHHPPNIAPAPHHHNHHNHHPHGPHYLPPGHVTPAHPPSHVTPAHPPSHVTPAYPPAHPPAHPPSHVTPVYPPAHHHHHPHHLPPSQAPAHPPSHVTPAYPPAHHHHHHHHPAGAPVHPPSHEPVHPPVKPPTHAHPPRHPPVHPPANPPSHGPAKPPIHPMPRRFVAVQGVVYCKSCKYTGIDNLEGATPVMGAIVKLQCNNTKHPAVVTRETDKNGYFFIEAPKNVTSYAFHRCKAFLVSSPLPTCKKLSNQHGELMGAVLKPEKPFIARGLPFVLYTVGPFAFEPSCPR